MRFGRTLGALTAALLLTAAPAFSQAPPPAPTLTPPGSITPIPLVPGTAGVQPPAAPSLTPPTGFTSLPPLTTQLPSGYPAPMGGGTGPSLSDILSGTSSVPLNRRLGDLDGNWRRLTITGSVDLGTLTQMVTALLGSAGVGVYYTKGDSVTVGNTTYLVTYRTQPKVLDITNLIQMGQNAALAGKPPPAEKLTADTPLALTLLNLQSAGSLTDVKPFNLDAELAGSAAAVKAYNDLMSMMGTSGTSTPPTTAPHHPAKPKKKYPTT